MRLRHDDQIARERVGQPPARAATREFSWRGDGVSFLSLSSGAVRIDAGFATLTSCLLAHNNGTRGAAALVRGGILNLVRSTIEGNTAYEEGGALAIDGGEAVMLNQTVLSDNRAPAGALAVVGSGVG